MRHLAFVIAAAGLCCGPLFAQLGAWDEASRPGSMPARVVGKPYSATQVTNTVQTLANGSHIHRTTTYLVYQDEQGRFRTESTGDRKQIAIRDPVAMVSYNLDPLAKSARKLAFPLAWFDAAKQTAADVFPIENARKMAQRRPGTVVEDLGAQTIDGVLALGVRITTTIPVGSIGNDQELKNVEERWYSNDIHALVKSVVTDPRSGVYTYELTNIVRAVPDPALFQVPAGYTIVTSAPRLMIPQVEK